jgi:hypothetical protein
MAPNEWLKVESYACLCTERSLRENSLQNAEASNYRVKKAAGYISVSIKYDVTFALDLIVRFVSMLE